MQDFILPFQIDAGAFRGRLVRLDAAVSRILGAHDYPPRVAALLAETLALAAALAGGLKYDGIFTLQAQGKGPVSLLVADVTSTGDLRGYARFDQDLLAETDGTGLAALLGEGYLAFTVDQGANTDRYQGIVELDGDSIAACVQRYFEQSEQLATTLVSAARPGPGEGRPGWRSGALLLQRMPIGANAPIFTADEAEESWNRAAILLGTTTTEELLDPALEPERLLHRLYHDELLRLHDSRPLQAKCRCSSERVATTLRSFPRDEIETMKDESGKVVVVCEFCKADYVYDDAALDRLYAS